MIKMGKKTQMLFSSIIMVGESVLVIMLAKVTKLACKHNRQY